MRYITVLITLTVMLLGCATAGQNPVIPVGDMSVAGTATTDYSESHDPHMLWGQWTLYFNEDHTSVNVVPMRQARFHLNVLKFLEEYCTSCLQVTSYHNNGDGTINLYIAITHPFPGHPEYTGFDVKGIIMFNGSHEFLNTYSTQEYPMYPLWPDSYHVSWRLLGDPELLNADGYTYRWTPTWESGSDLPIMNYWEGKFASGVPTANINGFRNFYSDENRHMFETNKKIGRMYHISLPPGPVVAGYAVEACWEPPIKTPVTNPVEDFPVTANQPEAYHFEMVINDGNPITDETCCNVYGNTSIHQARAEVNIWYPPPGYDWNEGWFWVASWAPEFNFHDYGFTLEFPINDDDPPPDWFIMAGKKFSQEPDGIYQLIAVEFHVFTGSPYIPIPYATFDVFEVVVDVD